MTQLHLLLIQDVLGYYVVRMIKRLFSKINEKSLRLYLHFPRQKPWKLISKELDYKFIYIDWADWSICIHIYTYKYVYMCMCVNSNRNNKITLKKNQHNNHKRINKGCYAWQYHFQSTVPRSNTEKCVVSTKIDGPAHWRIDVFLVKTPSCQHLAGKKVIQYKIHQCKHACS